MSTTLAFVCPDCDRPCVPQIGDSAARVFCHSCCRFHWFAPWSYQEVLGAIGLEMMYQKYVANCRPQLLLHVSREDWIKIPAMEFLEPSQAVLALQAGVRFSTGLVLEQLQKQQQAEQFKRQFELKRN